jgi:hypothetical protein
VQIQAAHEALSAAHPVHSSKLKSAEDAEALREQCRAFDPLITFDAKHALQNASIVGECVMLLVCCMLIRSPPCFVKETYLLKRHRRATCRIFVNTLYCDGSLNQPRNETKRNEGKREITLHGLIKSLINKKCSNILAWKGVIAVLRPMTCTRLFMPCIQ